MPYNLLADLVVGLHFLFVLFVLFGGLLLLRWSWMAWAHLPAALWGMLIEFAGWICPLTPLEKWLRSQGDGAGYRGGFIEHYVLPVLYPSALTREIQITLGAMVLVVNLFIYWYVIRASSSRPTKSRTPPVHRPHG